MEIIHANGFIERLGYRGPKLSPSEKNRYTSHYNPINNKAHSDKSQKALTEASDNFISNQKRRALRHHSEERFHEYGTKREACMRFRSMNRVSFHRFREYGRGFNIVTNKSTSKPQGLPREPPSCFEVLFHQG